MAQKRFINYKDQIKSFDLVEKNIGIFKPGKYSGFDTISSVSGLIIRIGHTSTIEKTLNDGSQESNFGAFITPSGVIIHENAPIDLTISQNLSQTIARVDLIIASHTFDNIQGGSDAIYSIIQGPGDGSIPLLTDPTKQIILGKITIQPSGSQYSDLTFETTDIPQLGSMLPLTMYNFIKSLVNNGLPISTTTIDGIIKLATNAIGLTGTDNTKAITSAVLKYVLTTGNYVSDANYVATENNFTNLLLDKLDQIQAGAQVNVAQVKSDWNSTVGVSEILNKPNMIIALLQGTVIVGDVSGITPGANLTTVGFSSASVITDSTDGSEIQVNFPALSTSNYQPIITLLGQSNWNNEKDISFSTHNYTTTSFNIAIGEIKSGDIQNTKLLITLIAL